MYKQQAQAGEQKPAILAVLDSQMEVKFVSSYLSSVLQTTSEGLVGETFDKFLSSNDDFIYHFEYVKSKNTSTTNLIRLESTGDSWLVDLIPVANSDSQVQEVILVKTEKDSEPRLESELAISKQQLQDLKFALDQSSIVAITDRRGRITYINDKFCEISQYDKHELLGRTHKIINSGYHDKEFFKDLWATISSGKVWTGEIKNKAKDGTAYWVFTTIIPFVDQKGVPYQYISIRNDITFKKQVQEDLEAERTRTLHSEKMATLGILASGIAHELGNPLAALRGRLEMLLADAESDDLDAENVTLTAERLLQLSDRMNKIIRGLRAYARDGSKDPFTIASLSALVSDLLELVQNKCRKFNIELISEEVSSDVQLQCRETEIGQVIVNLINNSIDAIKDLPVKWIKIQLSETGDNVEFVITDSGQGIDQKVLANIFAPFFTTKPVGQGTGLGLSISSSLIESHGGKLEYVEAENTCFKITLPKKQQLVGDNT